MRMETPTISKAQKKSTLSAKKARPKETIKNVVATPFKNSYWPQLSPEDREMLKIVLQNNLPKIKSVKTNVPWRVLKNIPKSDRKKFRDEYTKSEELHINKIDKEGLTFGINDVTKLLESNSASVILVTHNVPKIMVRHIIDQAVLYSVPIIVYDDLRYFLFKVCGISSAVICITKNINPESKLNLIKESVIHIYEKYPPPLDHINYNRSLKNNTVEPSEQIEEEDKNTSLLKKTHDLNDDIESTIYLKRESNNKRVFVPENSKECVNIHKMEVDSTGFLPFSNEPMPESGNGPTKSNYKSLIVKRLKGDPNRSKRKIASLKRKGK